MRYDLVIVNSDKPYSPKAVRHMCHKRTTVIVFGTRLRNLARLAARLGPICDVVDIRPAVYRGETFISGVVLSYGRSSPFMSNLVYFGPNQLHEKSWIYSVRAQSVVCVNFSCASLMAQYPDIEITEVHHA